MKKLMFALFLLFICSGFNFQASAQDPVEDKIELSREGGTTRATDINSMMRTMSIADPVIVEAFSSRNVVTISVENYRGGAWIEISGPGGTKSSYIEVYEMGFDVISLSGLRAGSYNIRITLDSGIYSGTLRKGQYGRK